MTSASTRATPSSKPVLRANRKARGCLPLGRIKELDAGPPPGLYVGAVAPRLRENEMPYSVTVFLRGLA